MLKAWAEGIMFDTIAGAGWHHAQIRDELRASLSDYLYMRSSPEPSAPANNAQC